MSHGVEINKNIDFIVQKGTHCTSRTIIVQNNQTKQ